jgi:hypothetical protein
LLGTGGGKLIITGQTDYAGPTNMREPGGKVQLKNSAGEVVDEYPIIEPEQTQFNYAKYAYFTSASTGYTLHIYPAPTSSQNGLQIDYIYYKKPTLYTAGASISEVPDTTFIVHRMLANRYRASRNPYYSSAVKDAEEALKIMQLDNNSGTWDNPWKLSDNSGSEWGN